MRKRGTHAVVLGCSMAGMLAARALADTFDEVTIVERDVLPSDATNRRGVPQGRHVHALLAGGAKALEALFPGLLDDLVADGAPYFDGGDLSKMYYCMGGRLAVRSGSARAMTSYMSSRPFLEFHVRRRIRAIPNIAILDDHVASELVPTADRGRIEGVRVTRGADGASIELAADLVVDATGRGSRLPLFLESFGYQRPHEEGVTVHLTYVSQMLRLQPGALREMAILVAPVAGRPTGMAFVGCENNTWVLTMFGLAGEEPESTRDGMLSFAGGFAPPRVLAAARLATPVTDPVRYRFPSSRWLRYDRLKRLPSGLLPFGDAICSLNPIYAQGMTIAALQAQALQRCLLGGHKDLAGRFLRAATKPIGTAWQLATGGDLAMPEIEGNPSLAARIFGGYADRLLTAAQADAEVLEQFTRVSSLLDPPRRLLRPAMVLKALSAGSPRSEAHHHGVVDSAIG